MVHSTCVVHVCRAADLLAMESNVCWGVCQKVGHCDNFVHLNPVHRNNFLYACMKCKVTTGSYIIGNLEHLTIFKSAFILNTLNEMYEGVIRFCDRICV